ncbi:MAG TPA: TadE/TadG family type IV pilus assembly protein [Candidatus Saccharimonadales bacterium]|nr:TadE/TadG family type IV pilus assembly protein [Candidatus Saccharimonadales bacterium]
MSRRADNPHGGQAITELALIVPVLLLLVIGVADLGRLYTTMAQTEAGAREAADYGAFQESNWTAQNYTSTEAEMTRRACVADLGLTDYVGAPDGSSCSNPTVVVTIEGQDQNPSCPTAPPIPQGLDPPCIIHVESTYTFNTILRLPLIPSTLTFARDSRYAVSALPVPATPAP